MKPSSPYVAKKLTIFRLSFAAVCICLQNVFFVCQKLNSEMVKSLFQSTFNFHLHTVLWLLNFYNV
jgi:hypothetical protein